MTTYDKFWHMFHANVNEESRRCEANNTRFVNYTSAENIIKIIENKSVWLRNSRSMNDYSEIQYGIKLLHNFFGDGRQRDFWQLIDKRQIGLADSVKFQFDNATDQIFTETYIACVSEIEEKETQTGRLSMWRAYAQNNGAAAVLRPRAMLGSSGEIGANTFPVIYTDAADAFDRFSKFVEIISSNEHEFLSLEPIQITKLLLEYFSTMTFTMKNKVFSEEKEWRIVYRPWWLSSNFLKLSIETVRGVPQPIYKFPLEDSQQFAISDISPEKLIEKILVGPSNDAYLIERALKDCLRRNDFLDFENRVFASNIPLRL
jgi:Protein of unknown function (DUF2971)